MANSFCIKTNNNQILDYLLFELENINLENIYLSRNNFKIYQNIVVHYRGENTDLFLSNISNTLSNAIVKFYEQNILKKIINCNYFYFSDFEKKEIFDNASKSLTESIENLTYRKNLVSFLCYEFLLKNKNLILDGLVNFRLQEYMKLLDETIDLATDKFLIDREYNEFISLLKLYINSKVSSPYSLHLVYLNNESILLDHNKNIIHIDDNIFNAKYLSDISFSSNDYALNTLLNLLPKKLYIHLINSEEDEFISTLKLIFDNRVYICEDCQICNIYKISNNVHPLQN